MTTSYIVRHSKVISHQGDDFDSHPSEEVIIELNKNNRVPYLSIKKNDEILLQKYITKNFAEYNFDDENKLFTIIYNDGNSLDLKYESNIKFDNNSSSAFFEFKKTYLEWVCEHLK